MGEEVRMSEYDSVRNGGGEGEEDRVLEWEAGLPSGDDLTPLSQKLIPPELALAFSISPEPNRNAMDVNRASQDTLSSIQGHFQVFSSLNNVNFKSRDGLAVEGGDDDPARDGSNSRKARRIDGGAEESENGGDDPSARTLKRPRLVWTPQLHKRFVEVVARLGITNAVPKTIMQLMNVEGLTRENVASHLQKYRLYLKRMQGIPNGGSSDQFFSSTSGPQIVHENGGSAHGQGNGLVPVPIPVPYPPQMMALPLMGMAQSHSHMGMPVGFDSHLYSMGQQSDCLFPASSISIQT
ncbi:hypothetical protein NMG60_11014558 [Bertholletia excelsa]